jgi:hypothetical protein
MTSRRGFLSFLAAAGIVALAPSVPAIAAPEIDAPSGYTFTPAAKFFDLITYLGLGSEITLPNSLGDEIGCVIVKCRTKKSEWFVLETNEANITLPAKFNEAGHRYVAYQFGKEAMPQIQPFIDKMKEMQA